MKHPDLRSLQERVTGLCQMPMRYPHFGFKKGVHGCKKMVNLHHGTGTMAETTGRPTGPATFEVTLANRNMASSRGWQHRRCAIGGSKESGVDYTGQTEAS